VVIGIVEDIKHIKHKEKRVRISTSDEIHIRRNYALIIASIIVLPGLCRETGTMTTVVDEEHVTRLSRSNQPRHGRSNVLASRLGVRIVCVNENCDILI